MVDEDKDVVEYDDAITRSLRKSLFAHVPPYMIFSPTPGDSIKPIPGSCLPWQAVSGMSQAVSDCVQQAGFTITQGQPSRLHTAAIWHNTATMETREEEIDFASLSPEAKINQIPGMYMIGRKDCLAKCYQEMGKQFGKEQFDFHPRTFILPDDLDQLTKFMEDNKKQMIMKPPNWFNGMGIKMIRNSKDIPSKQGRAIIQEYIDNPFLINGLKFDIRLYVLITSIDPLKIYIYEDGIVNFATVEYTNDTQHINNKFIHLTNYSINKTHPDFVPNYPPQGYRGHKWNLGTLWRYLREVLCIDVGPVWERTKEICLKTILCGHQHIQREFTRHVQSDYNCYKLLGFDILYDNLKPWILEVNMIANQTRKVLSM